MKRIYFLLVFFGALLFCACDKDNSDLLMEDPAQTQLEDGALKGAKKHAVPFRGTFVQSQTWDDFSNFPSVDLTMEGEGPAIHLGKTVLKVDQHWEMNFPTMEGAAKVVFTAANGDKLEADLYAFGVMEFDEYGNPTTGTVWGEGKFTGGTGRFEDATGSYKLSAFHDVAANQGTAIYTGRIKY